MAFSYGSDAINQLAQAVDREPADLSTKADATALATTDAVVATKQTTGEPVKADARLITTDTSLDPDIAFWLLAAADNDVTLTLPAVSTIEGRRYLFHAVDTTHVAKIAAATGETISVGPEDIATFRLPTNAYTIELLALASFGTWLMLASFDPRPTVLPNLVDTTAGDQSRTLPLVILTRGHVVSYKNTGISSHTLNISPDTGDTIDGGAGPVAVADGKTVLLTSSGGVVSTDWKSLGITS